VRTFIIVYLAIGFVIGLGLYGWAAVSTVRRQGFWLAVRNGARIYVEEFPLYWRVPVVAWMFVFALPLIAGWATLSGDFDPVGAIFVFLLWLLYLGLLRWHYRAKARAQPSSGRPRSGRRVGGDS
jgi:hypothetical protein